MGGIAGLGDGDHVLVAQSPGDGHLRRRGAMPLCHRRQRGVAQQPPALSHRRIGHHRNPPFRLPRQQVELDAAMLGAVQHLVHRAAATIGHAQQLAHVRRVEVGDAPGADLALVLQLLEGRDGLGQGRAATPVQQIEVDMIGAQPLQAARAGRRHAGARGVVRIHLADHEGPVALAGDRLRHHLLGAAVAVHLGGVDQRHAQVEAEAQRGGLVLGAALALTHPPGALADGRYRGAVG